MSSTARFPSSTEVVLIGAGRVGTAVAELLRRRGHNILAVASRSAISTRRSAMRLGAIPLEVDPAAIPAADIYLFGTSDPYIKPAADAVAGGLAPEGVAVHFAGALGLAPFRSHIDRGGPAAALHPVQACPDIDVAVERLPGSAWGVTCTPGHETWCDDLVRSLGGEPFPVGEEDRRTWHAASVMTSNGISALLAFGESLLEAIGVEDPDAVLGPLARGTIANALEGGGGAATLTGPVVRGEGETVAAHLQALGDRDPSLVSSYRTVARSILDAARRAGRTDQAALDEIERLLEDPA